MKCALLLIILASLSTFPGCARQSESQPANPPSGAASDQFTLPAGAQGIVTAKVEVRQLPEYLDVPAHLEADPTRVARVYSPAGGRLVEFKVRPGDRVQAGQTVAVVESSDASAALAAYAKAQADFRYKQEEYSRASDLFQHGAFAEKDFQQAEADRAASQADLENARRQLRVLNVNPDATSDQVRVAAPRSGVVLQTSAAAGEYSKSLDSSDPMCVIADLSTIWAIGDLLEKDLSAVKAGDSVELSVVAYPGETWKGRVGLIGSAVDPATRTLNLRVVLSNAGIKLRPAMFGSLRLLRSTHDGIALPASAVIREGNASYVFVEKAPGRFERRTVTLGPAVGNEFEILSGIQPSETVVTEGALLLRGEQ